MHSRPDLLFLTYIFSWCGVKLCRLMDVQLGWINDYLTDVVFIPTVAHLALIVIRRFLRDKNYRFPMWYLLFFALYASVILEGIAPRLHPAHTADWGDVAAYFLGALFYYFVHAPTCPTRRPVCADRVGLINQEEAGWTLR